VLFYDANPGASSYSQNYDNGKQFIAGDAYAVRFSELNGATSFKTYSTSGIATTSGFSIDVTEVNDSVYATNAIDGLSPTVTNIFTADYANLNIDLDTNTDFQLKQAYAFYCGELTNSQGMYKIWGAVTALDAGNYRNNTTVASLYFDETAGFVKQTDDGRWFRDDGARPALDPTTGGSGLEVNWRNPVAVVNVGSGVLPSDITAIGAEVATRSQAGELHADVRWVNDVAVTGDGQVGSEWGPA
jgi:hypothetical protein